MPVRCLIVDDEPLQQDILREYIAECSQLELKGIFSDGAPVPAFLKEHEIDLMFLDINMPFLNGIDLIKRLPSPPMVIFTTAYSEYAVEGFDLDAVDYLLKPISFERFRKAIARVEERMGKLLKKPLLFIKADKRNYRIDPAEILYIEALGDYVRVHLRNKTLTTHSTLKNMENLLPPGLFVRIHKSYLVALAEIDYVEGNMLKIRNDFLQISETFRNAFFNSWKNR